MEKFAAFLKKIKKEQLVLCFLFGVLLLVIVLPTKSTKEQEGTETVVTSVSTNAEKLEQQLKEALMQIEGIGSVEVSITLEPLVDGSQSPEIKGVLVIAQSGDNPTATLKIRETVMTLFQLEAHKIIVMKMK